VLPQADQDTTDRIAALIELKLTSVVTPLAGRHPMFFPKRSYAPVMSRDIRSRRQNVGNYVRKRSQPRRFATSESGLLQSE